MTWHNARSTNSNVSSQLNTKSKDYSRIYVVFPWHFLAKVRGWENPPVSLLAVISLLGLINDYILPTVQLQQPPSRPRFGCQQSTRADATSLFTQTSWHNSQTDDGCCFRAPSRSQVIDSLPRLFPQVIYSFNLIGVSELKFRDVHWDMHRTYRYTFIIRLLVTWCRLSIRLTEHLFICCVRRAVRSGKGRKKGKKSWVIYRFKDHSQFWSSIYSNVASFRKECDFLEAQTAVLQLKLW